MKLKIGDKVVIKRSSKDISLGVITDIKVPIGTIPNVEDIGLLYNITWFDVTDSLGTNTTNGHSYASFWHIEYLNLRRDLGID